MTLSRMLQRGIGLQELLLVLVIMSSVTLLGFKLYRGWNNQAYITEIQEQVNIILDGMRSYYFANCATSLAGGTTTTPVVVLSGSTTALVLYLDSKIQRSNPWVNYTDTNTYYGYIAQFNPLSGVVTYYGNNSVIGTVVSFTSQVAVESTSPTNANAIAARLGAECASVFKNPTAGVYTCANPGSGGTAEIPATYSSSCYWKNSTGGGCSAGASGPDCLDYSTYCNNSGYTILISNVQYQSTAAVPAVPAPNSNFAVFEQTPSYGSGHNTVSSIYAPTLIPFKQLYENSEIQGLTNPGKNSNSSGSYATNYYYCGS
jgi:type II secretory pathway pseudopilin PulG